MIKNVKDKQLRSTILVNSNLAYRHCEGDSPKQTGTGSRLLRFARNDGKFARNDGKFARNDGKFARNDGKYTLLNECYFYY